MLLISSNGKSPVEIQWILGKVSEDYFKINFALKEKTCLTFQPPSKTWEVQELDFREQPKNFHFLSFGIMMVIYVIYIFLRGECIDLLNLIVTSHGSNEEH